MNMSRNFLSTNEELRKGDVLFSNNMQYKACLQDDGNFVIYTWKPTWASDTVNPAVYRLIMQEDCNLVIYKQDDSPLWHTNTHSNAANRCRVQLTNDGNLVMENNGKQIWSSATSQGMKS